MPLSANLLKLESSILPRAKRATNRNNVTTKNESKDKNSGAWWSRRWNVQRRNVPDPSKWDSNLKWLLTFTYRQAATIDIHYNRNNFPLIMILYIYISKNILKLI